MPFFRKRQVTYVDVVREYGAVLAKPAKGAALTHRSLDLPYEIGLIKEAICQVAVAGGGTATREQLKAGFMQLASFVDEEPGPDLPQLPSGELSKEKMTEVARKIIETLGPSIGRNEAIAKNMAELAHEFEARCKVVEFANRA